MVARSVRKMSRGLSGSQVADPLEQEGGITA